MINEIGVLKWTQTEEGQWVRPSDPVVAGGVWVTASALTQGIRHYKNVTLDLEHDYSTHTSTARNQIFVQTRPYGYIMSFSGNDWHHTEEEAQRHVQVLIKREIEKAQKKLKKLEAQLGKDVGVIGCPSVLR
jgi:hypothetical protein